MLTIEDIQNKQFSVHSRGYDKNEVDRFLEDIMMQMDATNKELDELRLKCSTLYETINDYKKTEDSMKAILVLASDKKDEILAQATKKAEEIVSEAEAKANGLMAEATSKAQASVADAQARADELINGMDKEFERLKNETSAMKAEYLMFKTKVEDMLEAQLQMFRDLSCDVTSATEVK